MKNLKINVLTEVAIFAAIGWVLDFVQGSIDLPFLPNGGSIGLAMMAVFIIAYRRGLLPALLCGLIMGLLDMLDGFYAISDAWYKAFLQVGLDYTIGYAMCSLAAIFAKSIKKEEGNKAMLFIVLGCLVGMLGKFMCHFLSGVLFWPNDQWGGPFFYSLIYNSIYMVPSFILCSITMCIIYIKNKKVIVGEANE